MPTPTVAVVVSLQSIPCTMGQVEGALCGVSKHCVAAVSVVCGCVGGSGGTVGVSVKEAAQPRCSGHRRGTTLRVLICSTGVTYLSEFC